jgi:SNF2-related domain
MEDREGKDHKGRRESGGKPLVCRCPYIGATRTRDCVCFSKDAVYKSPLMSIRWKRLIVDEGHTMASSASGKSQGVCVAERLPVERRWIVSATPVSGLLGISMGMKVGETEADLKVRREQILEERRLARVNEANELDKLGRIVCDFLRLCPWAAPPKGQGEKQASWKAYISKGFLERLPGSTSCVRNILQRLMLRHRQEDIEVDVSLPPMFHTAIYLRPGYYEKLSMNLFLAALASNAVTSERQDEDYMFHPKNRTELRLLTNNLLKRAGFYWTGYSYSDVLLMTQVSESCLNNPGKVYSLEDRELLKEAMSAGKRAMENPIWNAISSSAEMGNSTLYVFVRTAANEPSVLFVEVSPGSRKSLGNHPKPH